MQGLLGDRARCVGATDHGTCSVGWNSGLWSGDRLVSWRLLRRMHKHIGTRVWLGLEWSAGAFLDGHASGGPHWKTIIEAELDSWCEEERAAVCRRKNIEWQKFLTEQWQHGGKLAFRVLRNSPYGQ
eukprot:1244116-Amphidinium_carterae.1